MQKGVQAFDFARLSLLAGREGSWESEVLMKIIWFGRELNESQCERPSPDPDHARPAPPKRVNTAERDQLTDILLRWVAAPNRYTEVAATLAFEVANYRGITPTRRTAAEPEAATRSGWLCLWS